MIGSTLAFAVLAGLLVLGAYKVVASQYITHAALFLALTLVSVAGIFVLLNAPFLAAVQVLVYVGAVIAVFVFAVMLSELQELGGARAAAKGFLQELRSALRSPYWGAFPVAVAGLLVLLVLIGINAIVSPAAGPVAAGAETTAADLGRELFTTYLLPFEIAGVVLLVAMVGAIALAREGGEPR